MTKRKDEKEHPPQKHGPAPAVPPPPGAVPDSEPTTRPFPVDAGPRPEPAAGGKAPEEAERPEPVPTPEQAEIARLTDRLLRLQADFDNFRKRTQREREEIQKRAAEAVLSEMIPILDHIDFGIQQASSQPEGKSFANGLTLIRTQLLECLRRHGLEEMDALGREFDPRLHESMAYAPSKDVPEGRVMAQTRKGYRLGDRLLRAAMVMVSGGPGPGNQAEPGNEDAENGAEG